ncbi:MAG: hypothetical protein JWR61_5738 [Ferruginibacter sp.]|uniref:hypothetical protein n=1 Tax=Ferruginibacter sp. TaxID=1940288 RepID=UPI0026592B56|nr:hypothetical protein [Ferruginibacter sp.]MDB5280783.1 hypothetical protein [Ferruginibacter sp.]
MYTSKAAFLAGFIMTSLFFNNVFAQPVVKQDSVITRTPSFILYLGGGFSSYVANINPQPESRIRNVTKTNAAGTFRLMWHPGHRLWLGIESGYTNFFSYELKSNNETGKVSLHAVPMMVVWSMPVIKRISIFAGIGSYLLTSDLKYHGNVHSKFFSLGSDLAVVYTQPVAHRFGLAAEVKWMNAFETRDNALGLQVQMVWQFIKF